MIYLCIFSYLLGAFLSYGALIVWNDDIYSDEDLTVFLAALWPATWTIIVLLGAIDMLIDAGEWIGHRLRKDKD